MTITQLQTGASDTSAIADNISKLLKEFSSAGSEATQVADDVAKGFSAISAFASLSGIFGAASGILGIANMFLPHVTNADIINAISKLSDQMATMESDILSSITAEETDLKNAIDTAIAQGTVDKIDTGMTKLATALDPTASSTDAMSAYTKLLPLFASAATVEANAKTIVNVVTGNTVGSTEPWFDTYVQKHNGSIYYLTMLANRIFNIIGKASSLYSFYSIAENQNYFSPQVIDLTGTTVYQSNKSTFGTNGSNSGFDTSLIGSGYYTLSSALTLMASTPYNQDSYMTISANNACSIQVTVNPKTNDEATSTLTLTRSSGTTSGPYSAQLKLSGLTATPQMTGGSKNQGLISVQSLNQPPIAQFIMIEASGSTTPQIEKISFVPFDQGNYITTLAAQNNATADVFNPLITAVQTSLQKAMLSCTPSSITTGDSNIYAGTIINDIISDYVYYSDATTNATPSSWGDTEWQAFADHIASQLSDNETGFPDYDWLVVTSGYYDLSLSRQYLSYDWSNEVNGSNDMIYPYPSNITTDEVTGPPYQHWFQNMPMNSSNPVSSCNVIVIGLSKDKKSDTTAGQVLYKMLIGGALPTDQDLSDNSNTTFQAALKKQFTYGTSKYAGQAITFLPPNQTNKSLDAHTDCRYWFVNIQNMGWPSACAVYGYNPDVSNSIQTMYINDTSDSRLSTITEPSVFYGDNQELNANSYIKILLYQ